MFLTEPQSQSDRAKHRNFFGPVALAKRLIPRPTTPRSQPQSDRTPSSVPWCRCERPPSTRTMFLTKPQRKGQTTEPPWTSANCKSPHPPANTYTADSRLFQFDGDGVCSFDNGCRDVGRRFVPILGRDRRIDLHRGRFSGLIRNRLGCQVNIVRPHLQRLLERERPAGSNVDARGLPGRRIKKNECRFVVSLAIKRNGAADRSHGNRWRTTGQ